MTALLALLLNPRVLGVLAVVAVLGFGWIHYSGLRADLAEARQELAAAKEQARQYKEGMAALEEAYAQLSASKQAAREAEAEVRTAPESDNGPVGPLLENLRKRRFGGQP